jgi:glutathione S-transferase
MNYVYFITLLMLAEYMLIGYGVSRARSRYRIKAPAVTGDPQFERWFRAQQNTVEQLIVVIPALWIFGWTLDPRWAAALGAAFIVARAFYVYGYVKTGGGRHYGYLAGAWVTGALLFGALWGVLKALW